ncbi:hypothetical protein MTR67_044521 [Solanum verrucosum]|uniref:Paired amphipathic helix protein Sin3-like 2 n=1 Tax=Solanum verrucosum TaxID=315347 RepID=A0AAF0ZTP1_SOLVR|nr:hypothetical protein MTR67_044521 [Solanum verrucosum]
MKRLRFDVIDTQPLKRTICSSHGESYGSSIDPVPALSYVREIKDTFLDQVEKHDMFLDAMKDLKSRSPNLLICNFLQKYFGNDHEYKSYVDVMMMYKKERKDINELNNEVAVLFNDHPDLLDKFSEILKDSVTPNPLSSLLLVLNFLLPCSYDIILNDEVKPPLKKSIHFEQVFSFVNTMKKHLVNNHEYKSFLDFMNKCRKEHKDVKEVYHEVSVLLNDRPDLLDEFSEFLPDLATTNPLSSLDGDKKLMK